MKTFFPPLRDFITITTSHVSLLALNVEKSFQQSFGSFLVCVRFFLLLAWEQPFATNVTHDVAVGFKILSHLIKVHGPVCQPASVVSVGYAQRNGVILPYSLNDLTTSADGEDGTWDLGLGPGGNTGSDVPTMFNRHKNKGKSTVTLYLSGSGTAAARNLRLSMMGWLVGCCATEERMLITNIRTCRVSKLCLAFVSHFGTFLLPQMLSANEMVFGEGEM